jgi:ribosomal protein L7Ae-like RNA K-turn-binding protein
MLLVGQDQVFRAISGHKDGFLVVTAEDCSQNVLRKLGGRNVGRVISHMLAGVGREELGRSIGVREAQIAALPINSGFAKKIAVLLRQEGFGIDE